MKLFCMRASLFALSLLATLPATATTLRDIMAERAALQHDASGLDDEAGADDSLVLPAGSRIIRNVSYGADALQRMDIYQPPGAKAAPLLVMVHGGAWRIGDKASVGVVNNKAMHWLAQGFVFVSVNYRLLPKAAPLQQANDIARALSVVQARAASWGGDPARIILLGHSAGAHLVALLASDPALVSAQGGRPWLGTIALDSAALDVVAIMQSKHLPLYDRAFGSQSANWRANSPLLRLTGKPAPMLLVCSSERENSCPHAQRYAEKVKTLGGTADVLPVALSYKQINQVLGMSGPYTQSVDSFIPCLSG